jgi:murein DD-endopeptidase MepM/ murein hydrolase activator NlpD
MSHFMIIENAKAGKTSNTGKTGKTWSSPGYTETTHTGRAALIILSFCIICSVVVYNNLRAPSFSSSVNKKAPTPELAIKADPNAKTETAAKPTAAEPARSNDAPVPPGDSTVPGISGPLAVNEADLAYLRTKDLLIPVAGVSAGQLHDSFYDSRSEGRIHQALDIMAAQGTPVLASAGGKVRLYTSDRGGNMIYVTDSSGLYIYYYAHLQRYADGLFEGKQVARGEVIGYVGDTGNAGAGNFHLHFGIAKVTSPGRWSGGEPINPYPLLTTKSHNWQVIP